MAMFLVGVARRWSHKGSSPHDVPQPLLLPVASEYGVDGLAGEGADAGAVEAEVLCDEAVLVGEGAAKDTHVVGLRVAAVSVRAGEGSSEGAWRLTPKDILGPSTAIQCLR